MFLSIYLPLFIIFINLLIIFALFALTGKENGKDYLKFELSRGIFLFSLLQVSIIFIIDYFGQSLYDNYNFFYILSCSLFVFIVIFLPIINIALITDFLSRFFLALFFAVLSSVISEFGFFSIYSTSFTAWTIVLSLLFLSTIISIAIIIYSRFFYQSIEQLFPFE